MTEVPDRLSTDPKSPHFDEALLRQGVGIRFKGVERRDVEEYCISGGWIRVALGKKVDRQGRPLTLTLKGEVEAWIERPEGDATPSENGPGEDEVEAHPT